MSDTKPLLPDHRAHLHAHGLTDATIDLAGIYSITDADEAHSVLGWSPVMNHPPVPALAFPSPELASYVRLRPDVPRDEAPYEDPVGEYPRLYAAYKLFPSLNNPALPLVLTVGEEHALAACEAGLPAIAASDVNTFHDIAHRIAALEQGRDRRQLAPAIAAAATPGRDVIIVFDVELWAKLETQRAAGVLARMLIDVGAVPHIGVLTKLASGAKMFGLGQLLVTAGSDAAFVQALLGTKNRADPSTIATSILGKKKLDKDTREYVAHIVSSVLNWQSFTKWIDDLVRAGMPATEAHAIAASAETFKKALKADHEYTDWMSAPGYEVNADGDDRGVRKLAKRGSTTIAATPINVVEIGTDEQGQRHVTLRFKYGAQEIRRTIPRSSMTGSGLLELASYGAPITQSQCGEVQQFLSHQEAHNLHRLPHVKIFTQFGWAPEFSQFVLGKVVIGGQGRAVVEADERFLGALRPGGNEATYRALCIDARNKNPIAEMSWAAGYAAPLIRLLGLRSVLFSIFGTSLGGKTAAQKLALSAWGKPEDLKMTGDTSPTALEAYLSRNRDQIVFIDDTQLARNQETLKYLAYQVGAGSGRGRGTQTGGMRQMANWLSLAFVSGEKPLLKLGVAAGAKNRTLETQFEPFAESGYPKHLHQQLDRHYGHTGPQYITALLDRFIRPKKIGELDALYHEISRLLDPEHGDESVDHVALLVTADILARQLVFGEGEQSAYAAALQAGAYLLGRVRRESDARIDPVQAGYEAIMEWVTQHPAEFAAPPHDRTAPRRFGCVVPRVPEAGSKDVIAILPPAFEQAGREAKFDVQQVLHGLRERRLLILGEKDRKNGGHRLGRKTDELGKDRPRAYWIVMDHEFSQDDDAPKASRQLALPGTEHEVPDESGPGLATSLPGQG